MKKRQPRIELVPAALTSQQALASNLRMQQEVAAAQAQMNADRLELMQLRAENEALHRKLDEATKH